MLQHFDVAISEHLLSKRLDLFQAVFDGEHRIGAIFFSKQMDLVNVVFDPADGSIELSGVTTIHFEGMSFGGLIDDLHKRLRGLDRDDLKGCGILH